MGIDLKYDTDQMSTCQKNIDDLITKIDDARNTMRSELEQIRRDWVSEGGDIFFDSIDTEWETSVQNCIDILKDLRDSLKYSIGKYDEIVENASSYLRFR